MQSVKHEEPTIEKTKKLKVNILQQIVAAVDVILWAIVILRVGVGGTEQEFIDWGLNVFFWSIIIVTALLIIELFILTFFIEQLTRAPIVLFTVFALIITIDVMIILFILYGMGFVSGIPIAGVF